MTEAYAYNNKRGFLLVEADADELTTTYHSEDGKVRDTCTLRQGSAGEGSWTCTDGDDLEDCEDRT